MVSGLPMLIHILLIKKRLNPIAQRMPDLLCNYGKSGFVVYDHKCTRQVYFLPTPFWCYYPCMITSEPH